ncbi:exosome complex component RRP45-like [Acanthaster planci]|uniref:Exosome complex component RRP45 n=1 Tax=Acanthaster planci TaxID=133434 RepID=A0A8B7Z1Z2_ACAPL|nr:exosome complex component RRP45-like [Acanthaster planci]
MKETPLSNVERDFLTAAIKSGKRIDGRETYDYRNIKITFGTERGCCEVQLGQTRVLAQVSCETVEPRSTRPTEGELYVNLELSPMASPGFEPGRLSEYGVELNRLLERCLKDSRAVDMESLCVVAGEKVWQIRVDVHVLNHDGSILDCGSIAAIAALSHFRRPDVTVIGESVTIHTTEDRDPVPLSVHHMPVCISFAFFEQGKYLLVDPTFKEESVMEGNMVVAMNAHRELCTVQMTGGMLLLKDQIMRCSQIAVVKVAELTELIKKALSNDAKARSEGKKCGHAESLSRQRITTSVAQPQPVDTTESVETAQDVLDRAQEPVHDSGLTPAVFDTGFGGIGEGAANTWLIPEAENEVDEDEMQDAEEEGEEVDTMDDGITEDAVRRKEASKSQPRVAEGYHSDSSEEAETVTLNEADMVGFNKRIPVEPSADLDLSVALKTSQTIAATTAPPAKKKTKRKGKKNK